MAKLFLLINSILLLMSGVVSYYILFKINPTNSHTSFIWILLICFVIITWSITAYLGYSIRLFLSHSIFKNRDKSYILARSERQGLLLGLLLGIQLALQGFLLFNTLSATILIIAMLLLEFFFITQETKQ